MRKFLLSLILAMVASCTFASDYVDVINQQGGKRDEGQRVIYEMNVGSFTSAGTFQAAQARLDDLREMGVDIVWLMPVFPRGGGINSPYAATNFEKTNPAYGSVSDLKSLVARAHELDMEVWLDWVPNHTATNADWVTTHPEYYVKSGGQMVHPSGYSDVYQLDYGNTDLVNAMNDCLKFWIDEADIDGYRCDYISSDRIPTTYWQTAIPLIKSYQSGKTISFLGEGDIASDLTRLKYAGFDYDYAWSLQSSLANYGSGNQAARLKAFGNTLLSDSKDLTFGRMLYLTNHDINCNNGGNTLKQLYGDNRYPLLVFVSTLYGMPMLYNGMETGGNQVLNYFSDEKINWSTKDDKMLNTIRTLSALKHEVKALSDSKTAGDNPSVTWKTVTNNTSVLAYTRTLGDSEVLVVLNMGTSAGTATILGLNAGDWSLWLDSKTISQGTSRKQVKFNSTQTFNLDAKGYCVYVRGTYSEEEIPEKDIETYTPSLESEDEVSFFLETPTEGIYNVWTWGDLGGGEAYTVAGSWPGDEMTLKGKAANGHLIYKYVQTRTSGIPSYLIVTRYDNGSEAKRLWDGTGFVNHGYYIEDSTNTPEVISSTGIASVYQSDGSHSGQIYNAMGQRISKATKGINIVNGKKYLMK